jgi:PAS domain-containing protein
MERVPYTQKLLFIKQIVEETAGATGKDFFKILVKLLAQTYNLHGVWVTEYDEQAYYLRSIAFWLKDHYVLEYNYHVGGTPCETAIQSEELFHVPRQVIKLFPDDPDLPPLGAVSYIGIPLKNTNGTVMGHLAALDNKPMKELPEFFTIFKLVAVRAEAELRRIHAERKLIEQEAKLRRLVNGSMNGMLEFNEQLLITQFNPAAFKLFSDDINVLKHEMPVKNLLSEHSYQLLLSSITATNQLNIEPASFLHSDLLECRTLSGNILRLKLLCLVLLRMIYPTIFCSFQMFRTR